MDIKFTLFWITFLDLNFITLNFQNSELIDTQSDSKIILPDAIARNCQPISWWLWAIENFPQISEDEIMTFTDMSYQELALNLLKRFPFWIDDNKFEEIINDAYGEQWNHSDIVPVKQMWDTNLHSAHLWYWPTMAFKNLGLELTPRIITEVTNEEAAMILWASSWDTLNAAANWVKGTSIWSGFYLPNSWTSDVQWTLATNGNVSNPNAITILADVPFDPLQSVVKHVNWPEETTFREKHNILNLNSINIWRILGQVVYYFSAYSKLLKNQNIQKWEQVNFSVPSWNFWDALAWYYAMKMWLPIEKILVATNENDMLDIFFKTWVYEPPKKDWIDYVWRTNSPSMDIAKSSNLERMIFDICDFDSSRVKDFYDELKRTGKFKVSNDILEKIQKIFLSSSSKDSERDNAIKEFWKTFEYWIDPHTAAAVVPWLKNEHWLKESKTQTIFLETSHVAQFWNELKRKGIIVPWMDEFDETINQLKQQKPVEWRDYINIQINGKSDEEAFKIAKNAAERAFNEILPEKMKNKVPSTWSFITKWK